MLFGKNSAKKMNVKYFIIKGKKKYSSIYVRFWDSNRIDQKTKVGFSIENNEWSKPKQRLKISATSTNTDLINNKLESLEKYIVDKYNKDYNSSSIIGKKWLKDTVHSFHNRKSPNEAYKIYFLDWIKQYTPKLHNQLHNGNPLSENTIKNYKVTESKIEDFEKYKKKKYTHEEINLDFHRDFIHYCKNELKINNNTTGLLIGRIKTFCKNIELENLPISPMYKHKNFYKPKNETHDIYLNEDEINKILKHDFKGVKRLSNTRDLFIIGLRTGLRLSDISQLTEKNLLENSINITAKKTNQNLNIPIHPQVREIINKRNGKLPTSISRQNFNLYIKEITQKAGITTKVFGSKKTEENNRKQEGIYEKWELVSSHTCRRSFATNLFLQGIDSRLIMNATGHKSEKQLRSYVKASQDQKNQVINQLWNEQNKNN